MSTFYPLENNIVSAVQLRDYEQMFFGTNQEGGYNKPFLEFIADTTQQVLQKDGYTYFHYPESATAIPLSASRLIQNGACAGPIPYKADRIYKFNADYKKHVHWGDANTPTTVISGSYSDFSFGHTGTWLCAWLSAGSPTQDPIWMDRFYVPGMATSGGYLYNTPGVFDIPSILSLDPGVWFRYFHVGDSYNKHIVDSLSGSTSALKLHLEDWAFPTTLDTSPYENNCIISDTDGAVIIPGILNSNTDNAIFLSGNKNYGEVVFDDSINLNDNFTVSFWTRTHDWENVKGHHILSKNFRGGWAVVYNCGFCNPVFTVFGSGGEGAIVNETGQIIQLKTIPTPSTPLVVQTDSNLFTWILDSNSSKRRLYKMDFDGNIVLEKIFDNTDYLNSLALSGDETIVVYESATGSISGFNSDGVVVETSATALEYNTFTFNLSNEFIGSFHNDLCIDNDGLLWESLSSGGLRKTYADSSSNTILTGITSTNITCDSQNRIWFTFGIRNYAIINSETFQVVTSGSVGTATNLNTRGLSLAREDNQGRKYDVGWLSFADNNVLYKIDTTGNILKTVSLTPYDIKPYQTRFTNYDWNRKFNYLANNKEPQLELQMTLGTDTLPLCGKTTLSFPATTLSNDEWHLVSFTKASGGDINFYTDSVLRASANIPEAVVYYDFENSLFIGTDAGKIQPLDIEVGNVGIYYRGYFDDIRIYDYVLQPWDLWFIHNNKQQYDDIVWNMNIGNQAYLEEIERFFKFKLPGSKSQFFNIRLSGLNITDPEVREIIEGIIKQTIVRVAPAYSMLYKIIWE